jgi:hypothetical protein
MTIAGTITDNRKYMNTAIMQPYFLPYIGYFQLINAVDLFIVYDNIKYTKKGWINRNRMLLGGVAATFSIAIKKDSDSLDIRERELAPDFNKAKLLNQFREAYRKAPNCASTFALIEEVLMNEETNLFGFLHASIVKICEHLGITTRIVVSSTLDIDHSLQSQDKVIALCNAAGASVYVNPTGGRSLYSKPVFSAHGLDLQFIESTAINYPQLGNEFVPWLSIVDVMMFNSPSVINSYLNKNYVLS